MTDVSGAAWVEEAFARWPEGPGFPVSSLIPTGFDALARILHPTRRVENDDGTGTWAEIAAERGGVMHPSVQFEALVGGRGPEEAPDWDDLVPLTELPEREARVLAEVLSRFTGTPEVCWFAIWDGYGSFGPPDGYSIKVDPDGSRRIVEDTRAEAAAFRSELARYPLVRTLWSRSEPSFPAREYFLFRGPVDAVLNFRFGVWWQPPNIWWPDDRAWCVATEVDGYDSYVGGTRACIDAVLTSSDLEVLPIEPDARLGPTDPLNPAPWDTAAPPV